MLQAGYAGQFGEVDGDIKEALLTRSEQFLTFLNAMQSFKNNRQIIYDAVKCLKLLRWLCQNIRKFLEKENRVRFLFHCPNKLQSDWIATERTNSEAVY